MSSGTFKKIIKFVANERNELEIRRNLKKKELKENTELKKKEI